MLSPRRNSYVIDENGGVLWKHFWGDAVRLRINRAESIEETKALKIVARGLRCKACLKIARAWEEHALDINFNRYPV